MLKFIYSIQLFYTVYLAQNHLHCKKIQTLNLLKHLSSKKSSFHFCAVLKGSLATPCHFTTCCETSPRLFFSRRNSYRVSSRVLEHMSFSKLLSLFTLHAVLFHACCYACLKNKHETLKDRTPARIFSLCSRYI